MKLQVTAILEVEGMLRAATEKPEVWSKERKESLLLQQALCSVGAQLGLEFVAATENQFPTVGTEGSDSNG